MGSASKRLKAVVAGAAAVGVAGSSMVAASTETAPQPVSEDVALAASITIPLLDIHTPPPVEIIRQLSLTLTALTNQLSAQTNSAEGTIYTLPGLLTNFQTTGQRNLSATRVPGQSIGAGLASAFGGTDKWSVLNFIGGSGSQARSSTFGLTGFTGGAQGLGAALSTTLASVAQSQNFAVGNIFEAGFEGANGLGILEGTLVAFPFDGFDAVGTATPITRAGGKTSIRVGSLEVDTNSSGTLTGGAGVCLGSAKTNCDGSTSFLNVGAPLAGGLSVNGNNIISGDFSKNKVTSTLGNGQLSVQGAIGGTVKVGNLSIGQPIPINIKIPNTASMMSSASSRQQQSVRSSFLAVPRNLGSDNGTASTGRHAARDAVNSVVSEVKAAVKSVTNSKPKHAKPDTES